MKNLFNITRILLALTVVLVFASCEKDEDMPTPTSPNGVVVEVDTSTTDTTSTGTNTKPTVSGTVTLDGTVTSYDISSLLKDADGDKVTIKSITAANGTVTLSGTTVSYAPSDEYFIGVDTLTVTINDGTSDATGTVKLNYTSEKGKTYALIAPYFGKTFTGHDAVGNLNIKSDGTLTSSKNGAFYGGSVTSTSGNWDIDNDGKFILTVGSKNIPYIVSINTRKGLTFTNASDVFQFWNE